MDFVSGYITEFRQLLDFIPSNLINQVIYILHEARYSRRQIFIMGNGGSASTASHFVADLAKNTRKNGIPAFRVMGLTDNIALMTAYGNDEGYENIFVQQLANFVQPGDVVIAISASGNSPNVLKAIELANEVSAQTIGFTGFNGGNLGKLVDINLHIPSNIIEQVEDAHLMLEHMIVKALREIAAAELNGSFLDTSLLQNGIASIGNPAKRLRPTLEMLDGIRRELEGLPAHQNRLYRTLELSLESLGAVSGSILTLDENGAVADAALVYEGEFVHPDTEQITETIRRGLAGWVLENRQAALVPSTRDDPRWLPGVWDVPEGLSRSAVSVPLMDGERAMGVLTLVHSQAGQFNQDHLVLLAAIAVFVSLSGLKLGKMLVGQGYGYNPTSASPSVS